MDILIKSFNRPYYLDRCLQSIIDFVVDSEMKIIVLDDGTPKKYLEKLQEKYPFIIILKSSFYHDKSNLISSNSSDFIKKIPIDLWISSAKSATDYFVLLEDDIWFNKPINLNELAINLRINKLSMLKLYWLGNNKLIPTKILKKVSNFTIYKENLVTNNQFIYRLIFHVQRLNINKIMFFFKINTEQKKLNYYHVYATAGVIFNKDYFLKLWDNHENKIDEHLQIRNALNFLKNNKNSLFGFLEQEIVKTGFASAATNMFKEYENINIDMFVFNKIINESWFNDEFITTTEFNQDLNATEIENILKKNNNQGALMLEWENWTSAFKKQYIDFGCKID